MLSDPHEVLTNNSYLKALMIEHLKTLRIVKRVDGDLS